MSTIFQDHKIYIFRCSHRRTVVFVDNCWKHVDESTGEILYQCEAGIYRLPVQEPIHFVKYLHPDMVQEGVPNAEV